MAAMWYEQTGKENDVVVSTRVRLARNFANYPFPAHLDAAGEKQVLALADTVFSAEDGWTRTDFSVLPPEEKRSYAERHLVSPEFAEKKGNAALYVRDSLYVMALEEDHLRIQSIYPGLALREALRDAIAADELLDSRAAVAYQEKWGYLTYCPTNLGSGLRASVMLFLPAYTKAGAIRELSAQLGKLGLTIRGMAGEGSAADGYLYQISNQVTLGVSEEETVEKLETVVGKIIENERTLRGRLQEKDPVGLADRCSRALGILRYCRRLSVQELTGLYAGVRLGAAMGILQEVTPAQADRLLLEAMPATLYVHTRGENPAEDVSPDMARAALAGEILGK